MIDALKRASAGSIIAVHPLLRLRAPGSQEQAAHADPRPAGRRPAHRRRRRSRAVDRSARRPDPGLLQHPRRPSVRDAGADGRPARRASTSEAVIVSPDAGGVERARAYSKRLGTSLAIIDKRRPAPNVSEVVNIIGDVKGRDAIIVDDMVDTAGTLCAAAQAVMDAGRARRCTACASHGVLSPPAIERIMASPLDGAASSPTPSRCGPRCAPARRSRCSRVARLLGEAVKRIHHGDSISSLFI